LIGINSAKVILTDMRIPQSFIDDVLNRTDIVEIIDRLVPLKKAGKEFMACCPFHTEKTASFTVSPQKQFYHCFGCGAHGTAIGFLMEHERLEFVEAIEDLAKQLGMTIPVDRQANPEQKNELDNVYKTLANASDYFQTQLRQHTDAKSAVEYLKNRDVSGEIAQKFAIGYAPGGWNNLLEKAQTLSAEKQRELDLLVKAGLVIQKDNHNFYDRFRHRIIFPIRNRRGKVVAFGGRVIDNKDNPKYLNSPETTVFHKGRELYGLYEAREASHHLKRLLVVEGYMDVVALAQFNINYAVATLGTATSSDHLEALFRVVKEVIFCFDGDKAGKQAAIRALEIALPSMQEGRQIGFLFLPNEHDPDTLVRAEGTEKFEQRIEDAVPLSDFLLMTVREQINPDSIDAKARFANLAKPLINKLPENVFRKLMLDKLADYLQVPASSIFNILDLSAASLRSKLKVANVRKITKKTPVRQAIALLLHHPQFAQKTIDIEGLKSLDLPGINLLNELLDTLKNDPNLKTAALLERWRDTEMAKHLATLATQKIPGDEEDLFNEFSEVLAKLVVSKHESRWLSLQQKLSKDGLTDAEKKEYQQLLDVIKNPHT